MEGRGETGIDWFDSQPTPGQRQVTDQCDNSQTDCKQLIIQERQLINVNESNVDYLFEELNSTELSSLSLQNLLNNKTKNDFISHIIMQVCGDEIKLEEMRERLFDEVKSLRDFPFPKKGELKKRIHTRKGEAVAQKLATDIFTLVNVLDGAAFEEMRDVISLHRQSIRSDTISTPSQSKIPITDEMQHMLIQLQTDMLQCKKKCAAIDDMKKDVASISSELKIFKRDINTILSDLQQKVLESSFAIERIGDERSLGIAQTKSDVKQLRSELRSCNDSLGLEMRQVTTQFETNFKQMEKRITKCEKRLRSHDTYTDDKVILNNAKSPVPSNSIDKSVNIVSENSPESPVNNSDVKCQQPMPIAPGSSSDGQLLYTATKLGPRFVRDSSNNMRKDAYSDVVKSSPPVINQHQQQEQGKGVNATLHSTYRGDKQDQNISRRVSTNDRDKRDQSIPVRVVSTNDSDKWDQKIPVRVSTDDRDVGDHSVDEEFGDFIQHVRKKSKRFFVGGFMPSISEASIRGYVKAVGGPNIITVDIIKPRYGNDVILRLTVEVYNSNLLLESGFWPDGVRCRPWFSRPSYNRQRANNTGRFSENTDRAARAGDYRQQGRGADGKRHTVQI